MSSATATSGNRQIFRLVAAEHPTLALHLQEAAKTTPSSKSTGDVLYVHGATFGAELSVFHRLDGQSWADDLGKLGLNVWATDFAGYGQSEPYPNTAVGPVGRVGEAIIQLNTAMKAIRQRNGNQPVLLVSHSWGASVAASYAATYPQDVKALVMFAPIILRMPAPAPSPAAAAASTKPATSAAPTPPVVFPLSIWAQYRRFVEDVPRGQPQALSEAHFQEWGAAFLASDKTSGERRPASVMTPFGPVADIGAMWSGQAQYDPAKVHLPVLLIRGAWDTLCTDVDAARLMAQFGSSDKTDIKVEKGTHLMLLEASRSELRQGVNNFLKRHLN